MERGAATRGKVAAMVSGANSIEIKATIPESQVDSTLARFGLVAMCAALFVSDLMGVVTFSFHWSLPHVAYSWPPMLFLVGLALAGFGMATSVGVTPREAGSPSRGSPAAA